MDIQPVGASPNTTSKQFYLYDMKLIPPDAGKRGEC